jgi:hypothetical protein
MWSHLSAGRRVAAASALIAAAAMAAAAIAVWPSGAAGHAAASATRHATASATRQAAARPAPHGGVPAPALPARPPDAELTAGSSSAQPVQPVQYAWYVPARDSSPLVGPLPRNWHSLPRCEGSRNFTLRLAVNREPAVVAVFRYPRLRGDGMPAGAADPTACSARFGCVPQRCDQGANAGLCFTVDTANYSADRVVVVYALWTVPGAPVASSGPPTDAASWGFIISPREGTC